MKNQSHAQDDAKPNGMGIYPTMSNEEYHSHPGSYSRSALMEFKRSPYHYWGRYLNPERRESPRSDAMIFGEAFHTLILEPDQFDKRFSVKPEAVLLKDVGRERYDAYKKEVEDLKLSNLTLLDASEFDTLVAMRDALEKHPNAMELINGAVYEQSYFWVDPESGLLLKSRPDILHSNMGVDLKTCADASPRGFQNAMVSGGYHIQGAMGRDARRELEGVDVPNFICLAIEKTYPHAIGIYIIDEYALDHGQQVYKQVCLDLKHALAYNSWGSYETQTISLPRWAL